MAARLRAKHQNEVRDKIRASHLVKRLQDFIDGKAQMTNSQVNAALGLLKKCVPDMAAVQVSGEVEHNYIARLPAVASSTEEWLKEHRTVQ